MALGASHVLAGKGETIWILQDRNWRPQLNQPADGLLRQVVSIPTNRAALEASRLGLSIRRSMPFLGAVAVSGKPSDSQWGEDVRRLTDQGFRVFPAKPIEPLEVVPSDPFLSQQWHLSNFGQAGGLPSFDLGTGIGWSAGTGTSRTIIAITDSGIQSDHIDLADQMWRNPREVPSNGIDDEGNGYVDDVFGWNSAVEAPGPLNDPALAGHGTAVAGTAVAMTSNGIGVAGVHWHAQLMPVVIFDPSYLGTDLTASEGIVYAVRAGAHIINASWGSRDASPLLQNAVEFAAAHGVPIVAAAGNDGVSSDLHPFYPAAIRHDFVVAVGGANRFGGWSHNFGRHRVTCSAPSVEIFQPRYGNGFGFGSGTSYAAPQVAAVLGLMRDVGVPGTAATHHLRIQATARAFAGLDERNAASGLVRLDQAVAANNDLSPPAAIADLKVAEVGCNGAVLTWTAVGDDGWIGTAAGYSVRVAERSLSDEEFSKRSAVPITLLPSPTGQRMSAILSDLDAGTSYVVQVRAHDEAGLQAPVGTGVPFLTKPFPKVILAEPCDFVDGYWIPAGGVTLAPGQPHTGALTWQDSPSGFYVPNSTATLTLRDAVDLGDVEAPSLIFWHRRQFPNNDRGDALVVELQRASESTVTILRELGGSWSPTTPCLVPVPPNLTKKEPVFLRFRLKSDEDQTISDGFELDDISIVDMAGTQWLPHYGEYVLQPKSWTGALPAEARLNGEWTNSAFQNLAPGQEAVGTWEVLVGSNPAPHLEWNIPGMLPGHYRLDVSWPYGPSVPTVAIDIGTSTTSSTYVYDQQASESGRWWNLGVTSLLSTDWMGTSRIRVRADLSPTSGTVLAPAIRLRWIYPLQSNSAADASWLNDKTSRDQDKTESSP
jgi:hypothetical protein